MLCVFDENTFIWQFERKESGEKVGGGGGGADKGFKFHTFIGRFQETSRQ